MHYPIWRGLALQRFDLRRRTDQQHAEVGRVAMPVAAPCASAGNLIRRTRAAHANIVCECLSAGIMKRYRGKRIVVIGASAGGIEAMCTLLAALPPTFSTPIFVVIHIGTFSVLSRVLGRCGALQAIQPVDRELILPGSVYVAPPNTHMLINDGHIELSHGPRENLFRPAIDPLFRSAARTYRDGVIGVILTGELDDGVAGLAAIKARGGLAIVQDPAEAASPSMPASAVKAVSVDYQLPLAEIAATLVKLTQEKTTMRTKTLKQRPPRSSSAKDAPSKEIQEALQDPLVPFACPECHGPMFKNRDPNQTQFHCLVGHKFSPLSLSVAHADALERALWAAIRSLNERLTVRLTLAQARGDRRVGERHDRDQEAVEAIERDIVLLQEIQGRI